LTGQPLNGAALDAVPFNLQANRNQPIWVDVLVPRGAAAGQYTGTFTVRSDQGTTNGAVALTVWNFALPMTPTLKSSFLLWQADGLFAQQELLRHKLSPQKSNVLDQRNLMSNLGLGSVGLPFWSGADMSNCTMAAAPPVSSFLAAATAQQPGLMLYDYSADEIGKCTNLYPNIKQWARNMHLAGVNNLVTMAPTPALYDDGSGTGRSAVDIWVLLPLMYEQAKAQVGEVLRKGDSVWSYNTLVQDPYSPKWMIDFTPINFRIQPGFINQSLGLTGLLYWRADLWSSDPWNNVNNAGTFSSANFPGEGMLLYPGQKVGIAGVAPSMRLKWLRDGVEDYEYVAILKKLGRGDWALQLARGVGSGWSSWTRDRQALESVRQQLGAEINRLSGGGGTAPGPSTTPPATSTNLAPAPVAVTPSSGSGLTRTFQLTYSDQNGASTLAGAGVLINKAVSGANACWLYYEASTNRIWLANNQATGWSSAKPGSGTTLQNSQCSLNAGGTSVAISGNTLKLSVPITFKAAFAGTRTLYLYAQDKPGLSSGYRALGTWTVR
jgi:hypothetical protein